jgi:2-keto-3-deoxy-L-rhamnonate aldolase RhmA
VNRNPLKTRLAAGKPVVGPYIQEFYTAGLTGIVAATGADFVIFDSEHSGWTSESLRTQIALARGAGLVALVNSPGAQYEREGLLLDLGARGLMVPHVQSTEQCEALVAATRYPPQGHRGGAFNIAHDDFRLGEVTATIADADDSVLIIAKLESGRAIDNAAAIMAVPGIDVALVTGFDLSLDLGIPGQLDHPDITGAMAKVLEICKRAGKTAGCAAFDIDTGRRRLAEGYRFIQYSWDVGLLQESLRAGVNALRGE